MTPSMHYHKGVFTEQLPLVDQFVKHVTYHRALKPWVLRAKPKSPFWVDTSDAHLLQACIYWCMVFGSDGTNPTHWKRLAAAESEALLESFRSGLQATLRISASEWKAYRDEMVSFRNSYAAHHELDRLSPLPMLDRALEVAFYYDDWVRGIIFPDILDERPLRELAADLRQQVERDIEMIFQKIVVDEVGAPGTVA